MKIYFYLSTTLLLFAGCIKNNPDPSWLEVSEWNLVNNPNLSLNEGELTENISNAWVYIDDKLIGVFEVPFKIPILQNGMSKITLFPTILDNGISATKKIYPFLQKYEVTAELVQNATLHIDPQTSYKDNVQFKIRDFEDANTGFEDSPSSLANLIVTNDPAIIQPFNGNGFGRVSLTTANFNWISSTTLQEVLPGGGSPVYLELDYHNTADVITGVLAINSVETKENPNVQLNKQDPSEVYWKKIYIDLTTIVSGSPSAEYFRHSFESMLPEGVSSAQINIDNVKVVHY